MDISEWQQIKNIILKDADKKEEEAGYGGESTDRGAANLRRSVEIFEAGYLEDDLPSCWDHYKKQNKRERDPEYSYYLSLKKRFE